MATFELKASGGSFVNGKCGLAATGHRPRHERKSQVSV